MSFYDRIQNLTAWQAIGRPALSYCAASCTAGVVLAVGMPRTGVLRFGPQAIQDVLAGSVFLAAVIAFLAIIPTLMAVGILHETRLRRGITEAVFGALLGIVLSSPLALSPDGAVLSQTGMSLFALFGVTGAVAGLTYWLAMGRPNNPRAR